MRKRFLILFLLVSAVVYGQTPAGYIKANMRFKWTAGIFDSALHVPQYNGTPSGIRNGAWVGDGAIGMDTTNHRMYIYSGGAWLRLAKYSEVAYTFTTPLVNSGGTVSINGLSGYGSAGNIITSTGSALQYSSPTYPTSITTKGITTATLSGNVLNIPKDQRVGLYLNIGKTYTRSKPYIIGSVILGLGNSWASGIYSTGTPWINQLGTYYGKTVDVSQIVLGGDNNNLIKSSYLYGTFGSDTTTFVDNTFLPAMGLSTSGQPYLGSYYYNDHPNSPIPSKTLPYLNGTWEAFIANHYLDADWYAASTLSHSGYRTEVASDSVSSKSGTALKGLGTITGTKAAGKTSLVIGIYGYDSVKVRGGTVTVTLAGNTVYTKYLNGLNDANKGNVLALKSGMNYRVIALQNLPDSAATFTINMAGDSSWIDYIGYLKPVEKAVRPLYINNIGYGSGYNTFVIPKLYIDSANQMLQDAVAKFQSYPIFIQNTNNWLDSSININTSPVPFHLSSSGNDSIAKAYIANLIHLKTTPVNNAQWTSSNNNANYLSGNVGIGTTSPDSTLTVIGGLRINNGAAQNNYVWTSTGTDGRGTWKATAGNSVNLVFGGGSGESADTAVFTTSAIYGSFYNESDTLYVQSMRGVLQGSSPSVTYKVWYNTSVNNESGATALVTSGSSLTSTTSGTNVTSFDATSIPPGVWVWVKTSAVTTKPTYFSLTINANR